MGDTSNSFDDLPIMSEAACEPSKPSVRAGLLAFYLIAFVILLFTIPPTSKHSYLPGLIIAFLVVMIGAFQVARVGASTATAFIYGCGASFLFLIRLAQVSHVPQWLEDKPSTPVVLLSGVACCLFSGSSAAAIATFARKSKRFLRSS
ncbi:hypothetical protein [Rhodopirellula baltica]|uniref:Transmembrane protein n=1 Tax=Rhodopirellula baltica WH47 TaxID=991778 RepID=F2AQ96_RHOBT|nr:hypothetical protein [Rhodopirellula baltica]EGF28159.1 hypothetical protein RBWH47_00031 [Rhodopirellula baltica WH47]